MTTTAKKKCGAALVITIGFLAVLIIMILAFAAQTRSGRLAGRAYLSAAQCRQLLNTALVRAMEDIDGNVGTNSYPDFYAIGSVGDGNSSLVARSVNFDMEEDYFPSGNEAIWHEYSTALEAAQWQTITTDSKAVGRVGYITINTSGMLDANQVGGYTNTSPPKAAQRAFGMSPAEIHLSKDLLSELSVSPNLVSANGAVTPAVSPTVAFAYNRDNVWRHFESLRDVALLNNHAGNVMSPPLASFCAGSLFPILNPPKRINLASAVDKNVFRQTLQACGLSQSEAQQVYENYLDYVDADNNPYNLDGSSPEAVPMINEIGIENFQFAQNSSDGTNVEYRLSGTLAMETWFPFSDSHPENTIIECTAADPNRDLDAGVVEIVEGDSFVARHDYITINVIYSNDVAKAFVLPLTRSSSGTLSEGAFCTTSREFQFDDTIELSQPFEDNLDPDPLEFHIQLQRIDVMDIDTVDRVQNISFTLRSLGEGALLNAYASCIDPRINSDFTNIKHWDVRAANTFNAPNAIVDWGEETDLDNKNNIRFQVRNAPLQSAGELGFLSTGEPWRTVRLHNGDKDHPMQPILDRFAAGEPIWISSCRPGLVNLNSPHANVIATAFYEAPTYILPVEEDAPPRVSTTQARVIGANLVNLTRGMLETNLSFIGNAVSNNISGWKSLNDAQKDSIVANSYRLFGWRDTQYVLLLAAQNGTDFNDDSLISDDEVLSTQKAVVQIWRDPVTGKTTCLFYGRSDTLQSSIGSGETWGTILKDFKPDL